MPRLRSHLLRSRGGSGFDWPWQQAPTAVVFRRRGRVRIDRPGPPGVRSRKVDQPAQEDQQHRPAGDQRPHRRPRQPEFLGQCPIPSRRGILAHRLGRRRPGGLFRCPHTLPVPNSRPAPRRALAAPSHGRCLFELRPHRTPALPAARWLRRRARGGPACCPGPRPGPAKAAPRAPAGECSAKPPPRPARTGLGRFVQPPLHRGFRFVFCRGRSGRRRRCQPPRSAPPPSLPPQPPQPPRSPRRSHPADWSCSTTTTESSAIPCVWEPSTCSCRSAQITPSHPCACSLPWPLRVLQKWGILPAQSPNRITDTLSFFGLADNR